MLEGGCMEGAGRRQKAAGRLSKTCLGTPKGNPKGKTPTIPWNCQATPHNTLRTPPRQPWITPMGNPKGKAPWETF